MKDRIEIGDRAIGPDEPLFTIAECGVTYNGDVDTAKELIEVVAEAEADAIKFIFWNMDGVLSDRTVEYTYETAEGTRTRNLYEMGKELQLTMEEWKELKDYCEDHGVIMFSSVGAPKGVDMAEELDLQAYKLSSWDYNHHPLWRRIARLGKPMLIDTGPVDTLDVAKVMKILEEEENEQSALLHCYHTEDPAAYNMKSIPYLADTFDTLVGFSSRDTNDDPDVTAVALGARVLEKRLTLDRTSLEGHHHVLSKEPDEFSEWVDRMHHVDSSLGSYDLRPSEEDLAARQQHFNRIVADQEIPKGATITADMVAGKRPADGVSPEYVDFFVGRTAKRSIEENEPVQWEDV